MLKCVVIPQAINAESARLRVPETQRPRETQTKPAQLAGWTGQGRHRQESYQTATAGN